MNEQWHLDKKVPIALIVTIVMQTAVFLVWVGGIDVRVHRNEEEINALSLREARLEDQISRSPLRMQPLVPGHIEQKNHQ